MTGTIFSTPIEAPSRESLFLRVMAGDRELATATGFIVDSGSIVLLITCRHVATGRDQTTGQPLHSSAATPDRMVVAHNGDKKATNGADTIIWAEEPLFLEDGSPRWYEHPTLGAKADIIALPLTNLAGASLMKVGIGHGSNPIACRPTDMVSIVGYPFGKKAPGSMGIWSAGFIASEVSIPYDGLPVFLVDTRSRTGQSGSPVFAYRTGLAVLTDGTVTLSGPDSAAYRFLGVYSGRIHPESDIGMVWNDLSVGALVSHAVRTHAKG